MSKTPKISGNTMIKYLIRKGFSIKHRKGSHVKLGNNDLFTTVPAGNHVLKTGTMLGILQDVDMTRDDFVSDYNKGYVK